jgi:hypothetical protein
MTDRLLPKNLTARRLAGAFHTNQENQVMAQPDAKVIIPRRNSLVRAFGLTAAGATMTLPIVTVVDARTRAEHHLKELHRAIQDMYPGTKFMVRHRWPEGLEAHPHVMMREFPIALVISEGPVDVVQS